MQVRALKRPADSDAREHNLPLNNMQPTSGVRTTWRIEPLKLSEGDEAKQKIPSDYIKNFPLSDYKELGKILINITGGEV